MKQSRLARTSLVAILAAVLVALATALGYLGSVPAQAQEVAELDETESLLQYERNTVEIVETHGPSVVAINLTVEGQAASPLEDVPEEQLEQLPPFLRELLPQFQEQQQQQPQQGAGSGFVVDEEGHIVTNYHVVQQALVEDGVDLREGATLSVTFPGANEELPAQVVGANALYDLALLQLEDPEARPDGADPLTLGDAEQLRVGQKAIAIGNPFGFESTVTTGIVSAVNRSLPPVGEADVPLIQTDAAINPGNSGGPLLDSGGRVVAINTAIIPSQGLGGQRGSLGIGFAVPSTVLAGALDEMREGGLVNIANRPRLGIAIQDVAAYPDSVQQRLNLPDQGVGVLQVEPGSGAAEAGLQGSEFSVQMNGQQIPVPGDVIVGVDGEEVQSSGELQRQIFALEEGDTVTLEILRDGETMTVDVTLQVVPEQQQQQQQQNGDGGGNGND